MLTIHAATALRRTLDEEPVVDEAVAVSDDRIAAIGPLAELVERYPQARVRRWPGTLGPALVHEDRVPAAPTPRERIHALLRLGATAVRADRVPDPELRVAARRSGVAVLEAPRPPTLVPSARADLAVFDDEGTCVATVLAGRVMHRRA
ncbi:imidazolonepropionase-like domain-containing protein [Streptantibioticus ferralitis]|uniref:Aminodeoxyfutalosine deaminase/Imidazolonepropionase-like composite domain-containing protein n=1 Tax=Streptantibioticus ferralitis TaxID=236510 RepID=A0ABT5Z7Z8_9ACTN|nr:hypothetical protein [Streptantibioticus ferralitis]MDF2259843.1 hypothetical protein [Streptantibioticus ferralitis]